MKKKWLLLLFVCLIATQLKSQLRVVGKVVDTETDVSVPFTTVKFKDDLITADEKGVFILNIKENFVKTDSILLSCVGYETKAFFISYDKKSDTIYFMLKRGIFTLDEVVVNAEKKSEKDPHKIFKLFASNFSKFINDKPYDCKFLYREFSQQNGQYVDFIEAFGIKHFEGNSLAKYSNTEDFTTLQKFEQIRGVNTRVVNAASTGYHPATWQIAADYVEQILYRYLLGNFIDGLSLKLNGILTSNNGQIYKISFEPTKNNWRIPRNIYDFIEGSSGTIYLNTEDYSIEKVEFEQTNIDKQIKLKATNYKNKLSGLNCHINYVKIGGKSLPSYIDFTYFFKDITSSSLISKKIQFYFNNFDFEHQSTPELAERYNTTIRNVYPFRGMLLSKTLKFNGNPKYNPDFWNNEISYPLFWDMTKVENDFNEQKLVLKQEFKNYTNQLIDNK
jgi:hypothetical protein